MYVDLINIYKQLLYFLKNLNDILRNVKITKNNYIFNFNKAMSQKIFNFCKKKNGL